MNINELLKWYKLRPLPLRACLAPSNPLEAGAGQPTWTLEECWVAPERRPSLHAAKLEAFELSEGFPCLAVVAEAASPEWNWADDQELTDELLRTLVYVLSPAEPTVWQAISSWQKDRLSSMRISSDGGLFGFQIRPDSAAFADARTSEGSEFDSDLLAGKLLELATAGELEAVLRGKLGIKTPMHLAIVETPMLCESLTPVDPEVWRMHVEHRANELLHDELAGEPRP